MTLYFYSNRDAQYGAFSNFAREGFHLDGKWWKTSEHYFQAKKFAATPHEEQIRNAPSPKDAATMGRDRKRPLRPDWESVKDDIMREAVYAKFSQNPHLAELLLSTGEEHIVEDAPNDYYWGCGRDRSGKNMLGKILVETRGRLKNEALQNTVPS